MLPAHLIILLDSSWSGSASCISPLSLWHPVIDISESWVIDSSMSSINPLFLSLSLSSLPSSMTTSDSAPGLRRSEISFLKLLSKSIKYSNHNNLTHFELQENSGSLWNSIAWLYSVFYVYWWSVVFNQPFRKSLQKTGISYPWTSIKQSIFISFISEIFWQIFSIVWMLHTGLMAVGRVQLQTDARGAVISKLGIL